MEQSKIGVPEELNRILLGQSTDAVYAFVAIISLPDLGHEKVSHEQLIELAKKFNRFEATAYLARLNLYLSLAFLSHDPNVMRETQKELTRNVLSLSRLEELERTFGDKGLYDKWILLNRAQLLVGIKLIALYGREDGGNCVNSNGGCAQVGELALAINSCYGPGLGEPDQPLGDVVAQLAATAELYNPPSIVNGLVRTRILLGPILHDYCSALPPDKRPPPFERIFTLLNGLNFRDFLDIMLYLSVEQQPMLSVIMRANAMAYVDVVQAKRYVSGRFMKAWAELMCIDHRRIKDEFEGSQLDLSFFFDLTPFRRFPLWRASDNRRYFCIDAAFLQERLSSQGFYWTVINGLVDSSLRSRFQQVWGEVVQEYVRRLIASCCNNLSETFARRPTYDDDGSEVFDSAVISQGALIAIEIKASVVPTEQKYAGKAIPFFDGISAKFGGAHSAAVEQLKRNIASVFNHANPRTSRSIRAGQIEDIFPVIIVHEPIMRFGIAAHAIVKEFSEHLSTMTLRRGVQVHPLQIVDIEEIEFLEPYLQNCDFNLVDCLRAKGLHDPQHRMGFWHFMTRHFLPARGIKPKSNERIIGLFDWLVKAAIWRLYRGDYYDPTLGSRGDRSERALICARPVQDELLSDEVGILSEHANVTEAYRALNEIRKNGLPKEKGYPDVLEFGVVDEFGFLLGPPCVMHISDH